MEVLMQVVQQLKNQVIELTHDQQCNLSNDRVDDNTEASYHPHHQATHTSVPPPLTTLYTSSHPFSEFIMSIPLSNGFCLPGTLELYDGTIDSLKHLTMFNSQMLLSRGTDSIMCYAFPSSLKMSTLLWFSTLEPKSIHDFPKLATLFLTHFSTSRAFHKTSASLINLKQE